MARGIRRRGAHETLHNGVGAFDSAFPTSSSAISQGASARADRAEAQLKCIANTRGHVSFEAHIVDISAGGVGFIVHSPAIPLETGTLLLAAGSRRPTAPWWRRPRGALTKPVDAAPGSGGALRLPPGSIRRRRPWR